MSRLGRVRERVGRGPSRRVVAGAMALAALAGGLLAGAQGGSKQRTTMPSGGSRFADGGSRLGGVTLFDALAPLLAADRGGGGDEQASLGRAVAQLLVIGVDGTSLGSTGATVLRAHSWGGVVLSRGNYVSPAQARRLVADVGAALRGPGGPRPFVIARQAGGDSNAFAGLAPASEPQLGAVGRADLTNGQAQLAARQLRSLGVNGTLSPIADIGDPAGPAAGRAYGADPVLVSRLTAAAVRGYRSGGLLAVVGHFPGEGAASQDPAAGTATVGLSMADLQARDLTPFAGAVHTAPVIQMSGAVYAAFDGVTPATILPAAVNLLRHDLGYRGLVMSADLRSVTAATGGAVGAAAVAALRAGCDMLYVPGGAADALAVYGAVIDAVRRGQLDARALAASYGRLLAVKRAYRLL